MIKTLSDLYTAYPQFFLINEEKYYFEGTLLIEDYPCMIEMKLPNFPIIKNFKCFLKNAFITLDITNDQKINQNWNIKELLHYIHQIWIETNQNINSKNDSEDGNKVLDILNQILICQNELDDVKMYSNDELTIIKFDNFYGYEGHCIELELKDSKFEIKNHTLPNISEDWDDEMKKEDETTKNCYFTSQSTIIGYLKQFKKLLENFETFYKYIGAIDQLCWVVEPTNISLKHNWRMFKLIDNVYFKVILNPLCPNSININLYGPTSEVELYREIYSENINRWDVELDVYNNLLKIFDLMLFPSRDTTINTQSEEDMNCKICLCYLDDDGHIPICSCDNLKCNLVYHIECLKRWFASSVNGVTFLNVTIGNCPFCKEKLSASFRSLLNE